MKRITIGGIGNVLMGDDGVGPYVARQLEAQFDFSEGVAVEDLGTPGLDLIVHVSNLDGLILIDCVDNDDPAGTVTLYRKPDILRHAPAVRVDPHSPALKETLLIADLEGAGPKEVVLIGVTGQSYDFGSGLTDAVRNAVKSAVANVLAELQCMGGTYTRKVRPSRPDVWWDYPEVDLGELVPPRSI